MAKPLLILTTDIATQYSCRMLEDTKMIERTVDVRMDKYPARGSYSLGCMNSSLMNEFMQPND